RNASINMSSGRLRARCLTTWSAPSLARRQFRALAVGLSTSPFAWRRSHCRAYHIAHRARWASIPVAVRVGNKGVLRRTSREVLGLKLPSFAPIGGAFADPTKRIARDLGKAPAHRFAGLVRALLDDVVALCAADLARIELSHRVAPKDMPGIEAGIVDAQRRAVEHAGQNPDVLDGAAFEHPAEVNLTNVLVLCAVVAMDDCVHGPASNQPAIEFHLVRAVARRTGGMKRIDE